MKKLTLKVINTDPGFEGLKSDWNLLLKESNCDNIFLSWEWLYTWWESFKEGKKLFIIAAEEEGRIIGIAPLCLARSREFG